MMVRTPAGRFSCLLPAEAVAGMAVNLPWIAMSLSHILDRHSVAFLAGGHRIVVLWAEAPVRMWHRLALDTIASPAHVLAALIALIGLRLTGDAEMIPSSWGNRPCYTWGRGVLVTQCFVSHQGYGSGSRREASMNVLKTSRAVWTATRSLLGYVAQGATPNAPMPRQMVYRRGR
jgi:hypothetical protein